MTQRQARAIRDLVENGGNIGQAMIKAGYSKATSKTPQKLTSSIAWKQAMSQHLPLDELFRTHKEALQATKWNNFRNDWEADHSIRLKAVEMAYKLKGYDKHSGDNNEKQINIILDDTGYKPPENALSLNPTNLK